jgi:hypothetical protein
MLEVGVGGRAVWVGIEVGGGGLVNVGGGTGVLLAGTI